MTCSHLIYCVVMFTWKNKCTNVFLHEFCTVSECCRWTKNSRGTSLRQIPGLLWTHLSLYCTNIVVYFDTKPAFTSKCVEGHGKAHWHLVVTGLLRGLTWGNGHLDKLFFVVFLQNTLLGCRRVFVIQRRLDGLDVFSTTQCSFCPFWQWLLLPFVPAFTSVVSLFDLWWIPSANGSVIFAVWQMFTLNKHEMYCNNIFYPVAVYDELTFFDTAVRSWISVLLKQFWRRNLFAPSWDTQLFTEFYRNLVSDAYSQKI